MDAAEIGDGGEPGEHDRPKDLADSARSEPLNGGQDGQDDADDGQCPGLEGMGHEFRALHCRQDADCGGKNCFPNDETEADDRQKSSKDFLCAIRAVGALNESDEGRGAAFAFEQVIQHSRKIFETHDRGQRPDNHGTNAENVGASQRERKMDAEKTGANGVERTRADISIDNAEALNDFFGERFARQIF